MIDIYYRQTGGRQNLTKDNCENLVVLHGTLV